MILEVKIFVYNEKKAEITGKDNKKLARFSLQLECVCHWYEEIDEEQDEVSVEKTIVYFKNGESVVIHFNYDKFSELMKTFVSKNLLLHPQIQ